MNENEFRLIQECFLEQVHTSTRKITEAFDRGDLQEVARAAHKLRGGRSFGFPGIGEHSAALEDAILSGTESINALVTALYQIVEVEVAAYQDR